MTATLVFQILNMLQAGFNWLAARGITRERATALLAKAKAEDRDVTTAEAQAELDVAQTELDETAESIAGLPE